MGNLSRSVITSSIMVVSFGIFALMASVSAESIIQPPAWPNNWSAFYLKINSSYPSDMKKAGIQLISHPYITFVCSQSTCEDLTYGCEGGAFKDGSCRGIFKDDNFY